MSRRACTRRSMSVLLIPIALGFTLLGCPPGGAPDPDPPKSANVSVVLGSNVTSANKANLGAEEKSGLESLIASLTVSVTQISVDYAGTEPPSGGPVETFNLLAAPIDVDLFHLDTSGLSQLLAGAQLPAGYYTALHILFENPRLVLQTDPDTVVLDLSITAQGELTLNSVFELPEGDSILLLDIGGIHFSFDSSGGIVLVINLSAEVVDDDEETEVEACGIIDVVHADLQNFEMSAYGDYDKNSEHEPVDLLVDYSNADIYLPGECDTPTGTPEDLVAGLKVEVEGTMTPEGAVQATKIKIKEDEDDDEDEAKAVGVIDAVHPDLDDFEMSGYVEYLKTGGQEPVNLLVQYAGADIYLPTDGDTPTGTEEDLEPGLEVKAYGTLTGSTLVAYKVRIRGPEGSEPVQKVGEIEEVHADLDKFELSVGDHDYLVLYASADIYLPEDGDVPTGTEADLVAGAEVLVIGTKTPDHVITATAVKLLSP